MVETTTEEREKVSELFGVMLNKIYPGYGSRDGVEIKITQLTGKKKEAHIKSIGEHEITLGIHFKRWREFSAEKKIALLIHEITHLEYSHHKRSFWREFIDNYQTLREKAEKETLFPPSIEDLVGREVDWDEVAREIVLNVNASNIDRRQMDIGKTINRVARKLDVEVPEDRKINPEREELLSRDYDFYTENESRLETVDPEKVEFEEVGADRIKEWLKGNYSNRTNSYYLYIPKAEKKNGKYIPVDQDSERGIELMSILTGGDKVRIEKV